MDVHLKDDDFSTLLSRIKHFSLHYLKTPIIAVTGAPSLISDSDRLLLADVLQKPFTPDELLDFIILKMNWKIPSLI